MALIRQRMGILSGFGESKYEIVSRILLPYRSHQMPLQGSYLLVSHESLDGKPSAILGRVVQATPIGDLLSEAGEDYLVDLVRLGAEHGLPEEVKQGRLRYRVSLRLLGQITEESEGNYSFSPSIRAMPHVGADVGLPVEKVLQFIARGCARSDEDAGARIGHLAIGDLAMDGSRRARNFSVPVHFRMESLVSRRTAVFARAGMGKSNFVKVLLTRLYERGGEGTPGTLIIDPEGEYAFRNASEPGLLDVPCLREKVTVFTDREGYDSAYRSRVAGKCHVNFIDLSPVDVVNNLLPEEKHNTIFANLLRSLEKKDAWAKLINLLETQRFSASLAQVGELVGKRASSGESRDVILAAIVNNMVPALQRMHSQRSRLIERTLDALSRGEIVILDLSLLSSADARLLASWVMNAIFANNQQAYTAQKNPLTPTRKIIPTLAVLEEAQFYLGSDTKLREDTPFVRWFKEGRKFQLGSIVVTQQPGAIGTELISQCDNFFVFHLLSRDDLDALERANLHYSGDVVTAIGHEPIPGNCFLWSGRGLAFVTCAKILHFRDIIEEEEQLKPAANVDRKPAAEVALPVKELNVRTRTR